MFLRHPKDIKTISGLGEEFSIETHLNAAKAHQWYFQEEPISSESGEYSGSTTNRLTITKCLPKHEGTYKCVITDESGQKFTSESSTLTVGELVFFVSLVHRCKV